MKKLTGSPFLAGMPLSPEGLKRFIDDNFDDSDVSAGSPDFVKHPERYGPEQSIHTHMPGKPRGVSQPPKAKKPKTVARKRRKPPAKKPAHAA